MSLCDDPDDFFGTGGQGDSNRFPVFHAPNDDNQGLPLSDTNTELSDDEGPPGFDLLNRGPTWPPPNDDDNPPAAPPTNEKAELPHDDNAPGLDLLAAGGDNPPAAPPTNENAELPHDDNAPGLDLLAAGGDNPPRLVPLGDSETEPPIVDDNPPGFGDDDDPPGLTAPAAGKSDAPTDNDTTEPRIDDDILPGFDPGSDHGPPGFRRSGDGPDGVAAITSTHGNRDDDELRWTAGSPGDAHAAAQQSQDGFRSMSGSAMERSGGESAVGADKPERKKSRTKKKSGDVGRGRPPSTEPPARPSVVPPQRKTHGELQIVKKPHTDVPPPKPPDKAPKPDIEVFESDPIVPAGFERLDVAFQPPAPSFPAGFTLPDPDVARGAIAPNPLQLSPASRVGRRPPPDLSRARVIRPVSAPQRPPQDVLFDAAIKKYEEAQARMVRDFEATFAHEIGRLESQITSLSESVQRSRVAMEQRRATGLSPFERVVDDRRLLELTDFVVENDPHTVLRESGVIRQPILVTFFELLCKVASPDLIHAATRWAAVFLAELDPADPAVGPIIKGLMANVAKAFTGADTQDAKIVFHLARSLAM